MAAGQPVDHLAKATATAKEKARAKAPAAVAATVVEAGVVAEAAAAVRGGASLCAVDLYHIQRVLYSLRQKQLGQVGGSGCSGCSQTTTYRSAPGPPHASPRRGSPWL